MHAQSRQNHPGKCPQCGMELVPENNKIERGHGQDGHSTNGYGQDGHGANGYGPDGHNQTGYGQNKPGQAESSPTGLIRVHSFWTSIIIIIAILFIVFTALGKSPAKLFSSALILSFAMFWQIFWALVLGFGISAGVQAVVSRAEVAKIMPDDSPKSLAIACGLGAASSSCSYAAVAIAHSLFKKGANFTSAIVFEFASTNLVIELGIILWALVGWQFTLAEFIGGIIMIIILAALFKLFLQPKLLAKAKEQADKNLKGIMEGHAAMDMSIKGGTIAQRIFSNKGFTAISNFFFMDVYSVWKDILAGLLIAGALGAWVPNSFWQHFFLAGAGHSEAVKTFWGALVGPLVSVISFVCSIGNVPLAAVLWNGGISFAGVISFIFADLIVLPVLNIYRKYYGLKMAAFLFATSYAAMALAGIAIEYIFKFARLLPTARHAIVSQAHIALNYTGILNIIFLAIALLLLARFIKVKGFKMLKMM